MRIRTFLSGRSRLVAGVLLTTSLVLAASRAVLAGDCTPPPSGLVGWWTGDGNARDLVGGHHGMLRGGATATAPAVTGSGFSFDGTNRYVEIPDSPALKPAELTVECWVRFDNLDAPGTSVYVGQQYLVFKQNSRYDNFEGYVLSKDRTHADIILWEVTSRSGELVRIDSTSSVTSNAWYHLAGVRGSNYIELYFNGVLEARAEVDFPQDYGARPLYFGTSGQDYYDRKLNGMMDEVALYNRALSAQEIRRLYVAAGSGKCRHAAGNFRGLFTGNSFSQPGSGSISLSVTSRGAFSGKVAFEDGSIRSLSGHFDSAGAAVLPITKGPNAAPMTLSLHQATQSTGNTIAGSISDGSEVAPFLLRRAEYNAASNPCPKAGRYTLAIPGAPESITEPGGSGYATVSVTRGGSAVLQGCLGDGTPISHSTAIVGDDKWPFYARLYSGRGCIMGWVELEDELSSEITWTRPPGTLSRYYPAGFTVRRSLEGSSFRPPHTGAPVLDPPGAILALTGGYLASPVANEIQFGPGAKVTNLGPNRMAASFSRSSGLFVGTIIDPDTSKPHPFSGVLLQKQHRGAGLFRDRDRTGNVEIRATQ